MPIGSASSGTGIDVPSQPFRVSVRNPPYLKKPRRLKLITAEEATASRALFRSPRCCIRLIARPWV